MTLSLSILFDEHDLGTPPADRSRLATLVQHGTGDEMIEVARARESVATLRSLGVEAELLAEAFRERNIRTRQHENRRSQKPPEKYRTSHHLAASSAQP